MPQAADRLICAKQKAHYLLLHLKERQQACIRRERFKQAVDVWESLLFSRARKEE